MTKEIMTLWYRAPEVILDNLCYSPAIDLWSAGVIIYEMLTGEHMFRGNSEIDMIFKIFHLKGTPISDEKVKIKKADKENLYGSQPVISNFGKYPHLLKYGAKFPQFKKKDLNLIPHLKNVNPIWHKIIDGLTNLDPLCRMSANRAIDLVR